MSIRKFLIPAVAGLLISPALMAADLDTGTGTTIFSSEYLSTASPTSAIVGPVLSVVLGVGYQVGDILTLDFTATALDTTSAVDPVVVAATAGFSGITMTVLSSSTSHISYRVTDITNPTGGPPDVTNGLAVQFAGAGVLSFDASSVGTANGVSVSFSAATSTGVDIDTGGGELRTASDYLETEVQFSATVDVALNGVIDVNQGRLTLDTAPGVTEDVGTVNNVDAGTQATFNSQDVSWQGDFSWIIDTDDDTDDIQPATGVVAVSTCTGISDLTITATEISYSCTAAGATTLTLDPDPNVDAAGDNPILPASSITVVITTNFTGFGTTTGVVVFSLDGGAWVLNGYQAFIAYMPYGAGISQVIYIVNRGTTVGDITVEWVNVDGTSGSLGVIGVLGAVTTMSLGPVILAALPMALQDFGRLALTITANVPADDVQMNAQYNASGNRAFSLHVDNRSTPAH